MSVVYESASLLCCGLAAGAKTEMSSSVRNSVHFTGEWMCPLPLTRALRRLLVIQHRPSLGTSCIRRCQGPRCTPVSYSCHYHPMTTHLTFWVDDTPFSLPSPVCAGSPLVRFQFQLCKGRYLLSWCVQLAVCRGLTWDLVHHTGDSRSWAKVGTL